MSDTIQQNIENSRLDDKLRTMTYGFVGLGIMGGSLAKAIRNRVFDTDGPKGKILAMDIKPLSLQQAVSDKIIDEGFQPCQVRQMLAVCDFVFICLYPGATLDFLIEYRDAFKSGCIVTDISGVKTKIAQTLYSDREKYLRPDVDFILGHPMAGNEKEGYEGSTQTVFQNRNYIIMPDSQNKPENLELLKLLVTRLGIRRIIETDYITHDHKIAFTSQLCHVIASALVDSAEDEQITAFGGGSYEDLTRIALINAPLWTELFLSNQKELISMIENFENSLSKMKGQIAAGDTEGLCKTLSDVRSKRAAMATKK